MFWIKARTSQKLIFRAQVYAIGFRPPKINFFPVSYWNLTPKKRVKITIFNLLSGEFFYNHAMQGAKF